MTYDLVIRGRLLDPASRTDGERAIAIRDGRICRVAEVDAALDAREAIDARGQLVVPGLVDLHTHLFEALNRVRVADGGYSSGYGLHADRVGVAAGATTVVEQGGTGAAALARFAETVAAPSATDVRVFVNTLTASWTDVEPAREILRLVEPHRALVRGLKVWVEAGALSASYGLPALETARAVGDALDLPLYVHTGRLPMFPLLPGHLTDGDAIVGVALDHMRAGDLLGHCFSRNEGGYFLTDGAVNPAVLEAHARGVLFEVGHGVNFFFASARRALDGGVVPDVISSDVHGDVGWLREKPRKGWSLVGTMSKLWALGMPLDDVVRATTVTPARVLGLADDKGAIAVGRVADLTVLDVENGRFAMHDTAGEVMHAERRLSPRWTVRAGRAHAIALAADAPDSDVTRVA